MNRKYEPPKGVTVASAPDALVTGCSSGIGKATAFALAEAGFTTWATARRPETLADLAAAGCRVLPLDVTDEHSRAAAVATVEAEHGHVSVLVNNAGYSQPGAIEETPLEAYRAQFEVNVFGLVRMCQLVLPAMRAAGEGTIVNLGSGAGLVAPPLSSAYSMSKYSLEALSDSLRFETRRFGVRTVLIQASAVKTSFTDTLERLTPEQSPDGPYAKVTANVLGFARREGERGISPERVAQVVLRAVRSPHPHPRYKIGSQTRVALVARRALGDRAWDATMARLVRAV
jgi:NAD(P)-dependent dehydrogenase (short-subunit alcohol dehydrogenase family)